MSTENKPKILFYAPTPPPFAGPEVATSILLDAFESNRVKLIHIRSNVRDENVKKGVFDLEGLASFLRVYKTFLWELLTSRPDKVYFLLSSSRVGLLRDAVIVATSKLAGKRTIAHYRGGNFHNFFRQRGPVFQWLIKQTLKNLDCLIVQAESLKDIFDGLVDQKSIRVLYNGLPSTTNGYKRTVTGKPFTILYIGHVAFSKGFYELILAYLRLRRRYPIRLLFAGELRFSGRGHKSVLGFLSGEARKFFVEHGEHIEHFIDEFTSGAEAYDANYLGQITGEAKVKAFEDANIFVLPSYTEGFSMSVLEAMAAGLPVIVTPVGAFPEIVREGENGLFVPPGDSEALEAAIEKLLRDPVLAACMGERNRHLVLEKFGIHRIVEQLEGILVEA